MEDVQPGDKLTKQAKKKKREEKKAQGTIKKVEAAACSEGAAQTKDEKEDQLSLITWNVNGMDGAEQQERGAALCSSLREYAADVVFLQELSKLISLLLHKALSADYTMIEGGKEGCFTMMLLKTSRVTLDRSGIVEYPATHMKRNLLIARVLFKGQKVSLMTSQLESGKANTAERKRQLRLVMMRVNKACDDVTVLFGGDTNLTNSEVAEVGLPSDISDVWEQLGSPPQCRYTWDTKANTNLVMPSPCRFRFDRVYLRPAKTQRCPQLEPNSMTLIGQEKLDCGRFISHHWGIYCTFKMHR